MGQTAAVDVLPVDSGTYTWSGRNAALLPAVFAAVEGLELVRLLVLGCGCVGPTRMVPELMELRALLSHTLVDLVVVDHSAEAVEAARSCDLYRVPFGLRGATPAGDSFAVEDSLRRAASLRGSPSPASPRLAVDVVKAVAREDEGGLLRVPKPAGHDLRVLEADFEALFLGPQTGPGLGGFDVTVALNSLWYCAKRPEVRRRQHEFLARVLATARVVFVDEETFAFFGNGGATSTIWGPRLVELRL